VITKIQPLGDKIVVEEAEAENPSLILIVPDSAKVKPRRGTVIAISRQFPSDEVKIGDEVLYTKYSGAFIQINRKDCLILRHDDILGIVETIKP